MTSEEQVSLQPSTDSLREEMLEATTRYEAQRSVDAALYLLQERQLPTETVDTFRLGSVEDPLPGHESYKGMLCIPYLNARLEPVSLRFRCIKKDCAHEYHGKYMSMDEDKPRTYNVAALHRAKSEIHVAEGEFDAMVLDHVGLPAIAIPGVHLWQPRHRRMLAGYSRIWLWGDPDAAGAKFNAKVMKALPRAKPVRNRTGDVNDTFIQGGAEALHALVREGVAA